VLSEISGAKEEAPVPAYWSFSHRDRAQHPLLAQAASAFGEPERRGSEPDLIVDTRNTLFIMEAKLGSTNDTTPSRRSVLSDYEAAEGGW